MCRPIEARSAVPRPYVEIGGGLNLPRPEEEFWIGRSIRCFGRFDGWIATRRVRSTSKGNLNIACGEPISIRRLFIRSDLNTGSVVFSYHQCHWGGIARVWHVRGRAGGYKLPQLLLVIASLSAIASDTCLGATSPTSVMTVIKSMAELRGFGLHREYGQQWRNYVSES